MENKAEKNSELSPTKKTNGRFLILFIGLAIIGAAYGLIKYLHSKKHIETDNAQISALIIPVIPHISGYIAQVYVSDNQDVKKGDTLLVLDDRDFEVELESAIAGRQVAESNLTIAQASLPVNKANVSTSEANMHTIDAEIDAGNIAIWRANTDFIRYSSSLQTGGVTQQQYDAALAAKESAEKQVEVLQAQKKGAFKQTQAIASQQLINSGQVAAAKALLVKSEAAVAAAKLSLQYTVVIADVDGQLSKINLQQGQFVQQGQALFSIVPKHSKWVIANFKETQLRKMQLRQKVKISVDAYPAMEIDGFVSSFSPATGSVVSLLPADNASGNFVKVVQRLPVKIEFLHPEDKRIEKLSAGLNVVVDVLIDSLVVK